MWELIKSLLGLEVTPNEVFLALVAVFCIVGFWLFPWVGGAIGGLFEGAPEHPDDRDR